MSEDFQSDIEAIGRLTAVPTILDVVCRTTGMGFAAVARVTSDRWIACSVKDDIEFGLKPGGELKLDTTICQHARRRSGPITIEHVAEDAEFANDPSPALYGFQSCITVPIVLRDGSFFGTLCAIDPKPAQLRNPQTLGMFRMFADLIALHLDADARAQASEADLMGERKASELREQFIAVLGHDLRNPLASISAGTRLLAKEAQSERAKTVVQLMQASVDRMAGLIDNVLDFARARLGGGWTLHLEEMNVEPVIAQVVAETRTALPDRKIESIVRAPRLVNCDRVRISQLLSNLIGNAIVHGETNKPVHVVASTEDGVFELSVSNAGKQIPPDALTRLFMPFVRGENASEKGLGLGLYIASEIAKAHGGMLSASSSPTETCFTFRMPLNA
ncbi:MAG TPA: GAF domain-containing sensor histidine kinase [Rhizomicrobium sp.]